MSQQQAERQGQHRAREMSLRRLLSWMIWLCVGPLLILATYLAVTSVTGKQAEQNIEAANLAKRFASAVDEHLSARVGALSVLAGSPLADNPSRRKELYREAQAFHRSFGTHVLLADPEMRMLFHTRVPLGARLPMLPRPRGHASAPAALKTGKPAVGDIFLGPIAKEPLVSIAVPVERSGKITSLLITILETRQFQEHLDRAGVPSGWSLTLLDSINEAIAGRVPPDLNSATDVDASGRFVVKSAVAPWSVVLEIPREIHRRAMIEAAAGLAIAVLAITLVSILGGVLVSRRLGRSIAALTEPRMPGAPPPDIREVAAVRRLLDETEGERRQAERALREKEEQLRLAVQGSGVGLWDWRVQAGETVFNERWAQMIGYTLQELAPVGIDTWIRLTHPGDLERSNRLLQQHFAGKTPMYECEVRMRHKEGHWVWILDRGMVTERDPDGKPVRMTGTHLDISERKRAEESLREREDRLRLFIEYAPAALAMFDSRMCYVSASRRWLSDYNLGDRDLTGLSHYDVFPEIPESWKEAHRRALAGEVIREENDRFVRSDGLVQWIRWEVRPWRDQEGAVAGILIFREDITERKQAEEQLRESEDRFRTLVEGAPEAIFVQSGGRFVYVNPSMVSLMGAARPEDLLGKEFIELIAPEYRESVLSRIKLQVETGRAVPPTEQEHLRIDGSRVPVETSAVPVRFRGSDAHLVFLHDITDRKRAEAVLRERQEVYRAIVDQAAEGIVLIDVETHRFAEFNDAACLGLGYRREEFSRLTISDIQGSLTREEVSDRVRSLLQAGHASFENRQRRKDGTFRDVLVSNRVIDLHGRKYLAGIWQDITERKHAEEHLRQSEERFRLVVESSPDAVFVQSESGRIVYTNPAAVRLFGVASADRLIGTSLAEWIPPAEHASYFERIRLIAEGGVAPLIERTYLRLDGTSVPTEVTAVPFRYLETRGSLVFARDISKRKLAEQALQDGERSLRQLQKMEALGTLAGGIAHDFNNILGVVIGYTELAMLDTEELPDVQANLEQVHKAGIRAQDLVKQILTFSRQSEQERKIISISPLIKEAVKMLRATIPTSIKISYVIPRTSAILADPSQIHQIIMNLVTNAAHAMQGRTGGEIVITIEERKIDDPPVSIHLDVKPGGYVVLKVRDNGSGIPDEIIDKIFDPFFTTKETGKGTGMGLAVVHGIIKSHGGAIRVESQVGKGSTFTVYFPALERDTSISESKPEVVVTGSGCILFVDDEEALVDIGVHMLERFGYSVDGRTSSQDALEAFTANPQKYDLVITDYTMPGMNGLALSEALLRIRPDIPIILCTGFSDLLTPQKVTAAGVRKLIMKPVVKSHLTQAVSTLLPQ
jgi:PAS domain S-box-containing protein